MRIGKLQKAKTSTLAAPALCLLLALSAGACGSSTDVIFVPSQVLAEFAVFQSTTNKAAGPTIENYAYYLTTMPTIALGGLYVFRVTLEDGTRLESSVTVPAQSLQVFSPQLGATLALNAYLDVEWTGGSTPATRHVSIVLRRESTEVIFSVLGLGPVQVPDTGILDGQNPPPPYVNPILVLNARETGDAGTGTRYLTVTRNNTVSVGGFYAGSFAQGSLIFGQEVTITP